MSNWYVVNTLPHQEIRAESNLLRQGFRAWLPSIMKSRKHARRIENVRAPIFPCYLFVKLDMEKEAWGKINNSFGVRKLLATGERPQVLASDFVETLRENIESDADYLKNDDRPKAGSKVRIVNGPFTESIAKVLMLMPGDRVRVLLDILGGEVATSLPLRSVSNIA